MLHKINPKCISKNVHVQKKKFRVYLKNVHRLVGKRLQYKTLSKRNFEKIKTF